MKVVSINLPGSKYIYIFKFIESQVTESDTSYLFLPVAVFVLPPIRSRLANMNRAVRLGTNIFMEQPCIRVQTL